MKHFLLAACLVVPLATAAQDIDAAEAQRRAALRADFDRMVQEDARRDMERRQIEQAQREQASRDVLNGLMLMNAARPQPQITCRSTRFFDTVTTTCN